MSSTYNVDSESDEDEEEEIEVAAPIPKNSTWHLHDIEKVCKYFILLDCVLAFVLIYCS
jgi:hypothetical protein